MAKFKHRVKLNGVYYEAGQEVPIEEVTSKTKDVKSSKTVVEEVIKKPIPTVVEDKKEQPLTKAELIKIAKELGIEIKGKPTNAVLEEMIRNAKEVKEELTSGVKEKILTSENPVNEEVNIPIEGNENTGNEDNENSSFLDEVMNGNE